jgi:hypothetical protein
MTAQGQIQAIHASRTKDTKRQDRSAGMCAGLHLSSKGHPCDADSPTNLRNNRWSRRGGAPEDVVFRTLHKLQFLPVNNLLRRHLSL